MRIIVIGAGIFGVTIALELSKTHKVTLVDMNNNILQNASRVNHSRLHFGYHYPRSKATAAQCLDGYDMFRDYFHDAITDKFENYYMIEKNGKISSSYYERFCDEMGLTHKKQYPNMNINLDNIKSSYLTNEPIFDYSMIKIRLETDLMLSNIKVILNKKITCEKDLESYDIVINASYFNINKINQILGLPQTKLRLQTVIIPIFKAKMDAVGLTIMDGKFCSIMPKGFTGDFLLYHAKESIIYETESEVIPYTWYIGKEIIKNRFLNKIYDNTFAKYHINNIVKSSRRYFKFLDDCEIIGYWQTVRALPINTDDGRLSLFKVSERGSQNIISVMSGKISTCLMTAKNIRRLI